MKWLGLLLSTLPFSYGVIKGSSIFGLETQLQNTDYSWEHPASFYIDELGRRGFNYLRVPFSAGYVKRGDFSVMDEVFNSATKNNMNVLLDWHRNLDVGFQGDWLEGISFDDYLTTYKSLINRYLWNPQLRMIGLFNEYKGMDAVFWTQQMEKVVLDLEQTFPNRFIWVIGCPQWSGNCHDMDWSHLPFYDRVRYDCHKYIFSIGGDRDYEEDWSFSFPKDHSKVIIGEWGFFSQKQEQVQWAQRFVKWLKQHNIHDSFFWVSVSNSGDTGGLWIDGKTFDETKYAILKDLWDDDHHRGLVFRSDYTSDPNDPILSGDGVEMKYAPIPINNCQKIIVNETDDDIDDWGDDEDDRRNLQGWRRRPRKCYLIGETYKCVFHRACAWNKDHGCFRVNQCFH